MSSSSARTALGFLLIRIEKLPFAVRWIAVAISKSLIASLIMSFIANYATAYFALRSGFRVPVEGVPFLNFAVGLATFLAVMGTQLMFGAIIGTVYYLKFIASNSVIAAIMQVNFVLLRIFNYTKYQQQNGHYTSTIKTKKEAIDRVYRNAFGSTIVLLIASVNYIIFVYSLFASPSLSNSEYAKYVIHNWFTPLEKLDNFELSFLYIFSSAILLGLWFAARNYGWIVAQFIATAMIFLAFSAGLFAPDIYGSFLRMIRSGGGVAVSVKINKKGDAPPTTQSGYLMLLTQTYVILMNEGVSRIVEIPLKEVAEIEYAIHPAWKTPDYNFGRQKDYIRFQHEY